MNKEFIPYEQAVHLRELGFNELCIGQYDRSIESGITIVTDGARIYNNGAPTFSQAFRWFREKTITNLVINDRGDSIQGMLTLLPLIYLNSYEIHVIKESDTQFVNHVSGQNIPFYGAARHKYHAYATSYEEAELDCLKKLIEIAKNK